MLAFALDSLNLRWVTMPQQGRNAEARDRFAIQGWHPLANVQPCLWGVRQLLKSVMSRQREVSPNAWAQTAAPTYQGSKMTKPVERETLHLQSAMMQQPDQTAKVSEGTLCQQWAMD